MTKKSKADINKNGKIEGWESARSNAINKSMRSKKNMGGTVVTPRGFNLMMPNKRPTTKIY
jgi:hypothetical protein